LCHLAAVTPAWERRNAEQARLVELAEGATRRLADYKARRADEIRAIKTALKSPGAAKLEALREASGDFTTDWKQDFARVLQDISEALKAIMVIAAAPEPMMKSVAAKISARGQR
jgi:hypothetical protein